MKKKLLGLSILGTFLSMSALAAGPVANIQVTGDIKPPTCLINNGDDEIIFEFNIAPSLLPLDGNLTLESQSLPLEVQCDATTYLSLTPIDNRSGTELISGLYNYGLGTYNDEDIGFYEIFLKNGFVRATPTSEAVEASFRKSLTNLTYDSFRLDKTASTSWTKGSGNSEFASGQVFIADISVRPTINGALRNVTDSVELDGETTLQFSFGL